VFDLLRVGLPSIEDAHGKKWMCLYQVSSDTHNTWYLAVETEDGTSKPPPQPCFLIAVPKNKVKVEP
jgi:hypothetical protein